MSFSFLSYGFYFSTRYILNRCFANIFYFLLVRNVLPCIANPRISR